MVTRLVFVSDSKNKVSFVLTIEMEVNFWEMQLASNQ